MKRSRPRSCACLISPSASCGCVGSSYMGHLRLSFSAADFSCAPWPIAASKKQGLWMGGFVPIGYSAKDRTLAINEPEAAKVREIFRLYLENLCVRRVQAERERVKLTTSPYVAKTGRVSGGVSFSRGHLYRILSNPIY